MIARRWLGEVDYVPIGRAGVFLVPSPPLIAHSRERLVQDATDRLPVALIPRDNSKARDWGLTGVVEARSSRLSSTNSFQSLDPRHGHRVQ
jgi:hypothetical protein